MLLLSACFQSKSGEEIPQVEYTGQGQYNVPPPPTTVSGTLKAKNFAGGKITLEARRSVICEYGRCPVLGADPVGSEILDGPGPFMLDLPESGKDLLVIATYQTPTGATRVAHTTLLSEATSISGIDLSFDRPYAPLR